eukprot:5632094-Amphidinium_carterae.1
MPVQDRQAQLDKLVGHLEAALERAIRMGRMADWHILVMEQSQDGRPFNRGALINAGFHYLDRSDKEFDQVR